jgi:hypothetical protein
MGGSDGAIIVVVVVDDCADDDDCDGLFDLNVSVVSCCPSLLLAFGSEENVREAVDSNRIVLFGNAIVIVRLSKHLSQWLVLLLLLLLLLLIVHGR